MGHGMSCLTKALAASGLVKLSIGAGLLAWSLLPSGPSGDRRLAVQLAAGLVATVGATELVVARDDDSSVSKSRLAHVVAGAGLTSIVVRLANARSVPVTGLDYAALFWHAVEAVGLVLAVRCGRPSSK